MAGLLDQFMAYIDANTPRNTRKPVNAGTVIDQGLLGGRIGQVPQRAQEMYQGLLGAPAELAALGSPAMRSQVDQAMTKPQPIDKDKAMQMAMDTLQTTSPVGGLAGMFIGKGAKTWDVLKAQQADDLLKQGIDPREVWKQTGTLKGVDGAWRQEIPDNAARMVDPDTTPGLLDKMIAADPSSKGLKGIPQAMALEDVLRHPELDRAYFNVREDSPSVMFDSLGSTRGNYSDGFVTLNNANILDAEPAQRSTMLHELQHAIQQREGWATGGAPDMAFRDARMWGKDGAEGSDVAQQMLADKMRELSTPMPIEDYAKQAWQSDVVTPEIVADYANYAKSTKQNAAKFGSEAQKTVAHDWYRRLAGEAEARLTQSRMGLDAAQRRQHYPYDQGPYGLDVPLDSLIVRGGLLDGPAMSVADDAGGLLGKVDNAPMGKSSPALTDEQIASALDESRWFDRGLKLNKAKRVYRGESAKTGKNTANFGRGLYTTTDKAEAAQYGIVREMKPEDLPSNPIRFSDEGKFREWESHVGREVFGFGRASEFNQAKGNVDEWLPTIDPTIDGIQIGTGKGAFFVKFPKR